MTMSLFVIETTTLRFKNKNKKFAISFRFHRVLLKSPRASLPEIEL